MGVACRMASRQRHISGASGKSARQVDTRQTPLGFVTLSRQDVSPASIACLKLAMELEQSHAESDRRYSLLEPD